MRRLLVSGLAAALALAALSGCGGDPYADYCDSVKSHQGELSKTLEAGGPEALLKALPTFEKLQGKAPSDIKDDWATLTKALGDLQAALEDADVDPATYDPAKPPAGVTTSERDRIASAATEVGGDQTRAALAAVDQHARDVCHAPLTL
jgi:hypothetical protein